MLTADGRQTFQERLLGGAAAWARGRGWALWKTIATCANTLGADDEKATSARRVLGEIFSECPSDVDEGTALVTAAEHYQLSGESPAKAAL